MRASMAVLAGALLVAVAAVAAGVALSAVTASSSGAVTRDEASRVAREFFTSLNHRRYERTCDLLAEGYLESHRLLSTGHCPLGLRVGFMWSREIRFRIGDVRLRGGLAVVKAVADGARGELVLAREQGRLKVLEVKGG